MPRMMSAAPAANWLGKSGDKKPPVAQLVEHRIRNAGSGFDPSCGTINHKAAMPYRPRSAETNRASPTTQIALEPLRDADFRRVARSRRRSADLREAHFNLQNIRRAPADVLTTAFGQLVRRKFRMKRSRTRHRPLQTPT